MTSSSNAPGAGASSGRSRVVRAWRQHFPFFRRPYPHLPKQSWELRRVWFEYNGFGIRGFRDYCPELLTLARDFRYLKWPHMIRHYVKGRRIVDLGCGQGFHGVGFVLFGAKSYTGLDPIVDLDLDRFKDDSGDFGVRRSAGWTPSKVCERLPRIHYRKALIQDLGPDEVWDLVVMKNVTEHLMEIEAVFASIPAHLVDGGLLAFRHPNFYAWGGHHQRPRFVDQIDPDDPEHRRYMDWNHLTFDPGWPDSIVKRQNRIRLHELRALTERYFEILEWRPMQSSARQGARRLTDEICARYPEFSREELLTQNVLCVARKKSPAARTRTGVDHESHAL